MRAMHGFWVMRGDFECLQYREVIGVSGDAAYADLTLLIVCVYCDITLYPSVCTITI